MTTSGMRFVAFLFILAGASLANAEVRIEISSAVPDAEGKIAVDVILAGGGDDVAGFQNDIVFDNTVVSVDTADCRINPAIGAFPLGREDGVATCADDPTMGPCKTLVRNLITCADEMSPHGCPTADPRYSRLRAIVAAIEVANANSIPDGVAYTCTFSVVEPALLPVQLFNTNIVVSNPLGRRLASAGEHGNVCVDEGGSRRCAVQGDLNARCANDFECASGHCDVCCDHQFNGICAAPRTPTPTVSRAPTRTPLATRTATASRPPTLTQTPSLSPTVTNTPTPKSVGDPCNNVEECAANLSCNQADGGVCCTSIQCPEGMACNVPGFEGYCVRGVPPTPASDGVIVEIGSAAPGADGFAAVPVTVRGQGLAVGGMQNDILFDSTVVSLDTGDCEIAAEIGLYPDGRDATSCFDAPSIGPCKNLIKNLEQCGTNPFPAICPQSAAPNLSGFRGIVAATAALNSNEIPDGVLYTCRFRVLAAAQLPIVLHNFNLVVSDPFGQRQNATAIDGRIDPPGPPAGSVGTTCGRSADCDSRNCIDGVCCSQSSCAGGESCAVSGEVGSCAPRRTLGEGCDLGADCESGNCDLHRDSAASIYRGACGVPRTSTPQPGECTRNNDCDSGDCVDGFCCAADRCDSGEFCNTGECGPPAEPGAPCTADEQCALGLCVDGACCVTGSCPQGTSCGVPTLEGVCREPFRLGSLCNLDEQCPTGFCTDGVCCESDSCPAGFVCSRIKTPGECIEIGDEAEGPPAGDSATPTAAAPGGLPTATSPPAPFPTSAAATVSATRTLPATPLPTSASAPPASATAGRFEFDLKNNSGCSMSSRETTGEASWLWAFAALLSFARRRARF